MQRLKTGLIRISVANIIGPIIYIIIDKKIHLENLASNKELGEQPWIFG